MPPPAEPRWNAPFVGIPSFLRSVVASDLDRLDVGFDLVEVNPMLDVGTGITS